MQSEMQGMLSLLQSWADARRYEATTGVRRFRIFVMARLDVLFLSPHLRLWAARPWLQPDALYVPGWQSWEGLNDRARHARRPLLTAWIPLRAQLPLYTAERKLNPA